MECVPGPWVLTAGEMGRIVLMEIAIVEERGECRFWIWKRSEG